MIKVIVVFICLLSTAWAVDVIDARCSIFDQDGSLIKAFPGDMCEFLEDGSRIQIQSGKMEYIDSKEKVRWIAKGAFHHDVKLDQNNKSVLILEETSHDILGCKTRFDTIKRFDIATGKLEHVVDFYKHFKNNQIKLEKNYSVLSKAIFRKTEGQYECNTTHINSFYQIEENSLEKVNPIFKKGNWLVHLAWTGLIVVFDKDFKEIVGQTFIDIEDFRFHDVQFSKEGKIVLYVNNYIMEDKKAVTAIAFIDPEKKGSDGIKIYHLKINDKHFNQTILGGIQFLPNDEKLISVYSKEEGFQAAFFDKDWQFRKKLMLFPEASNKRGQAFQRPRLSNLDKFLKNYKGP